MGQTARPGLACLLAMRNRVRGQAELVANNEDTIGRPSSKELAPTGLRRLHLWRRRAREDGPVVI